jgi:DNA-binding SARP family transcriptional activator
MSSELRFGLLGPLQVRGAAGSGPLRAGKHRVILASLLLQANRAVSIDELIERLWGDSPVGTARATVHQYVMRLRQTLDQPDLIHTVPDAYLIEVPPESVDLHRFDELVRRGQQLCAADNLAEGSRNLHEALSLWRGAALADIPSVSLQLTEVPRLTEQRLHVTERRLDVELRLRRDAEVIAELRMLTSEHPLRERFWYQLITALYRCGRQADALEAYQAVWRVMNDELGVAPGYQLRDLQEAIIAGREIEVGRSTADTALVVASATTPGTELQHPAGHNQLLTERPGLVS